MPVETAPSRRVLVHERRLDRLDSRASADAAALDTLAARTVALEAADVVLAATDVANAATAAAATAALAVTAAAADAVVAAAAASALSAHVAASDPHPGYLTAAEGAAAYEALGAVATHAGLADPHVGYQKESEKDAANGYAGLDSGTLVPVAKLPAATTTTKGTVELATSREDAANVAVCGDDARLDPFVASGGSHATGLVPDPGATAGTAGLLREDSTWVDFINEVNVAPSSPQLGTVETAVLFHSISPNLSPSVPLAANVLQVGDRIEIHAQGIQTVQLSTDSMVYTIDWGGVTLCSTGAMDPSGTSNNVISIWFQGVVVSIAGSAAVIIGYGGCETFTRGGSTTVFHRLATGSGSTSGTTVDPTAAVVIGISADRNTPSDDTDSQRLDWISLKVRRKMPG